MKKQIAGMVGILMATAAAGMDLEAPEMPIAIPEAGREAMAPPAPMPGAGMEMPEMPAPQAEHAWLQKFVGEWSAEVDLYKAPGQPPEKSMGSESVKAIGGFWILAENRGTFGDQPFTGIMTLGYSPAQKQYVATWVDSMTSQLWTYAGTVDEAGAVLTLEAEGPCPMKGGELARFKETIEFVDADHRVFTSAMEAEDGSWVTRMVIHYHRK